MSKVQRLREQLYLLQGSRCFYCDRPIALEERSLEHVIPSSEGGAADNNNGVVVCEAANQLLGCASPKQKMMMLKAGGGKIECPKKYTGPDGRVQSAHPVIPIHQAHPVTSNQANRGTDSNPAKPNGAKQGAAARKQKAKTKHQTNPRPSNGRSTH